MSPRRLQVTMWPEDLAHLDAYATRFGLTRSAAVRQLLRLSASSEANLVGGADQGGPGEELMLHNLVATEQVIKLIQQFLPGGPAAAAEVLPSAVGAAQERIAGTGRLPG